VFWRRWRHVRFTSVEPDFLMPHHALLHVRKVFPLRGSLFGFRRSDVIAALTQQRETIESLANEVDYLWREKEQAWHTAHRATRSALLEYRRSQRQVRDAGARADQVEAEAAQVVREAEERAARLTSEAADGFVEVTRQLHELVDLRDELLAAAAPKPRTRRRTTTRRTTTTADSVNGKPPDPAA